MEKMMGHILLINNIQYFFLGASFMFSAMIAWLFWRKGSDMLSRLVMALMIVMAIGFLKDAIVVEYLDSVSGLTLELATSIDVVAVPIYAFILVELCDPGRLTIKSIFICEAPFIVLPALLAVFRNPVFYYMDMVLAILFGFSMATWTCFAIPRYNKYLKATFSYDENIDLRWLQSILWAFFVILIVWALSCVTYNPWFDVVYMFLTLMLWIFICFFLYKHKSIVEELRPAPTPECLSDKSPDNIDNRGDVFARIKKLIDDDRIYLDPLLKLSDIARLANTNRTYASAYFSSVVGATFYDHINGLRVIHAMALLSGTSKRLDDIAYASGFNSRQSFHRVFVAIKGMTPAAYRSSARTAESKPDFSG